MQASECLRMEENQMKFTGVFSIELNSLSSHTIAASKKFNKNKINKLKLQCIKLINLIKLNDYVLIKVFGGLVYRIFELLFFSLSLFLPLFFLLIYLFLNLIIVQFVCLFVFMFNSINKLKKKNIFYFDIFVSFFMQFKIALVKL